MRSRSDAAGKGPASESESLRQQLRAATSLLAIQQALYAPTELDGVVSAILRHAGEVHPADTAAVVLMRTPEAQEVAVYAAPGAEPRALARRIAAHEAAQMLAFREPAVLRLRDGASLPSYLEPLSRTGIRTAVIVPLAARGCRLGLLVLGRRDDATDDAAGLPLLVGFASAASVALHNARSSRESQRLASHDSLTGLPNRRAFFDRLHEMLGTADRQGQLAAALFVDLDGFKRVNDTLGHMAGDQVLREVSNRLVTCMRQQDSVVRLAQTGPETHGSLPDDPWDGDQRISRLGGDEFAILLSRIRRTADAGLVATRIGQIFNRPLQFEGQDLFLSASIGIAVYPNDGTDADALLRSADTAMYCAKRRGKNCFQFYTKSMNAEASRHLHIETRLRSAIEHGEFKLWYQPQRCATSGELVGAEALLRWDAPDMGMVSPAEFIPLAETIGCINAIGEWVLRTACSQLRDWQERGLEPPRVAVNISARQLRQPSFPESIRKILWDTGAPAGKLEFEITETAIMVDDDVTAQALDHVDAIGIDLVLDDFGTGYSSLSLLRRYRLAAVKIDRTFVRELPINRDDRALSQAIVAMAHGLDLRVVAEGVETEAQARYLREIGCDELQGYLLGRPMPAEEFEANLRSKNGAEGE